MHSINYFGSNDHNVLIASLKLCKPIDNEGEVCHRMGHYRYRGDEYGQVYRGDEYGYKL